MGEVYRLGGWDVRYARVYALGSVGGVGLSITDGNGDQRELYTDYWVYGENGWANGGGIGGGFHPAGSPYWSDGTNECHASYRCDDSAQPPDWGRTQVGHVTIQCTPVPRTAAEIVQGFRGRGPAVATSGGTGGLDGALGLVLLLLDTDDGPVAWQSFCDALIAFDVKLHRSEYLEIAREAARLELLDTDWAAVEGLVQD